MENNSSKILILLAVLIIILGLVPLIGTNPVYIAGFIGFFWFVTGAILYTAIFIAPALGIIRRKTWALQLAFVSAFLVIFQRVRELLIFGTYGQGFKNLITLLVSLGIIYLVTNNEVRSKFKIEAKDLRFQKISSWIFVIIMVISIGFYCFKILPIKNKMLGAFVKPAPIVYHTDDVISIPKDYKNVEVFGWSLYMPADLQLREDIPGKEEYKRIDFASQDKGVVVLCYDRSPLTMDDRLLKLSKAIGINNNYELARKVYHEQIGITFLILRMMTYVDGETVYEFSTDGLRGFLRQWPGKKSNFMTYDYTLYDKDNNELNIVFIVKPNALSEEQIQRIICSVKRVK